MGLRVFTAGTFDLPHSGHVRFLRACAAIGPVTVAINTDEFITAYKGKGPVMSLQERSEVIGELRSVDKVIANWGDANCAAVIETLADELDIIAIGSDWARRDYYKQMGFTQDWLDERGLMLLYIPYTQGVSTTELKKRIALN